MAYINDRLMVCSDCAMWIANRDLSELDMMEKEEADARYNEVVDAVSDLDGHAAVGDHVEDFSKQPCECCGLMLAGYRMEVVLLKEED